MLRSWASRPAQMRAQEIHKFGLGALPLIAVAGFLSGQPAILVGAMIVIPVLLLTLASGTPRPGAPNAGLVDEATVVERLDDGLSNNDSSKRSGCVIFEIDDFKCLKEEWGPTGSTEIAQAVSDRILSLMRSGDVICRLGDASFALPLPHIRVPELGSVLSLIERLQKAIEEPISLDGVSVHVTMSAGFCLDTQVQQRDGAVILRAAKDGLEDAMRYAPAGVRGYSSATPHAISSGDGGESLDEIMQALRDGDIKAWFQPQICTDTGEISGFEALARWQHPKRGIIAPVNFISVLEEAGAMEELSETMLQHALTALRKWDKAGLHVPSVGVNFATQELRNPKLVERIKWDVDRYELDPSRLTVEILETVISETDDDVITRNIRALGSQGFRIDLDDFGTGHASLANIRRFKVDRIKIDRSFVTHVDDDPEQRRMIAAIVGLAERLNISTLAEGVETIGEKSILSQLGCNDLQGFTIAKPMPFEDTFNWLAEHRAHQNNTTLINRKTG